MVHPGSEVEQRQRQAKKLVMLSHIFGWGGLGVLIVFAPGVGIATGSGLLAGVVAGVGIASTIAGGILGQVGRAMQGRVI